MGRESLFKRIRRQRTPAAMINCPLSNRNLRRLGVALRAMAATPPHPDGPRAWRRHPVAGVVEDPDRRAAVIARGPVVRIPVRVHGLTPAELAKAGVRKRRAGGHMESVGQPEVTFHAAEVTDAGRS